MSNPSPQSQPPSTARKIVGILVAGLILSTYCTAIWKNIGNFWLGLLGFAVTVGLANLAYYLIVGNHVWEPPTGKP